MLELVPYRDIWPKDFEEIKNDILSQVGSLVRTVDHIGSTSIRGMIAKDVIDVQIGLESFEHINELTPKMRSAGFDIIAHIMQDHAPGHEFDEFVPGWEKRFFVASKNRRAANIHVRLVTGNNFEFALLFRDYLRQNAEAARAYEQLKFRLAEAVAGNVKAYTLVKDPVCDLIIFLARKWAATTGWSPKN